MVWEMDQVLDQALESSGKSTLLLGIDGACGTGKTTLGTRLSQEKDGVLLHLDDFYLPFAERGGQEEIGSNINKSVFLNEVLLPLWKGQEARFRPYSCQRGCYGDEIVIQPKSLVIMEGVYVFLPEFRDYFGLKVFLRANWAERKKRLQARGSDLAQFEAEWIPREERYFRDCLVEECCDFVVDTTFMKP